MAATATEPARMALTQISRGKIKQPHRIVLYGLDGVGKTTFAAGAPSPIFIGAEMGTAQMDVARFPQPQTWDDVLSAIRELATGEHDFKTLVIDTLDWLEPLAYAKVCDGTGKESIEDFGFGKGYNMAADLWRGLFSYLERLQMRRGMHVVLLAHGHIRPFKNPAGEDYDRWELQLNKKIAGLVRQWPDEVLFANYQVFTHEQNDRQKGVSNGDRVMHTTREAAWDAKNRHNLPEEVPLDWAAFSESFSNSSNDNNDGENDGQE